MPWPDRDRAADHGPTAGERAGRGGRLGRRIDLSVRGSGRLTHQHHTSVDDPRMLLVLAAVKLGRGDRLIGAPEPVIIDAAIGGHDRHRSELEPGYRADWSGLTGLLARARSAATDLGRGH